MKRFTIRSKFQRAVFSVAGALALLGLFAPGCSSTGSDDSGQVTAAGEMTNVALPDDESLKQTIDHVLDFTEKRYMSADQHAAWQVVHGIMAYGHGLRIRVGDELVPALDWVLNDGALRGWTMRKGNHGLKAVLEAGSKTGQGHEDQWLGYIAQCNIPWEQPIVVRGQTYQFGDLVTQAQWDIYDGMEASWTLIGLSTYLPLDAKWQAKDGSEWTIERILAMESAQDLSQSACGGSHRLVGMTYALNRHLAEGGQLTDGWQAAEEKIQKSIQSIKQYQQPDGSFSINYFDRAATSPDVAKRINTTGHQLELLAFALNDEQLAEPWVTRAVVHLCKLFEQTREMPIECGSLYHAAHGLQLYRVRRFGPQTFPEESFDKSKPTEATAAATLPKGKAESQPVAR